MEKKTDNRGGKRPGAGAKPRMTGGHPAKVYIDIDTTIQLVRLGNGSLSAGVRKASMIAQRLPAKTLAALVKIDELKDPDDFLQEVTSALISRKN